MGTPVSSAPKGTVGANKLEYKGYIGVIARSEGVSLNCWISDTLEKQVA